MFDIQLILVMLAVGAFAGFIAGLLGIGGGMIVVPAVLWVLQFQGLDQMAHAQHLAVGTSFAVMVFTTFSSLMAQKRKGAVDWKVVIHMAPGMIIGALAGSSVAKYIPNKSLQIFFIAFAIFMAVKTLLDMRPRPTSKPESSRGLPGRVGLSVVGVLFGIISSLVGIAGGSLSVPFLLYCHVPIHKAVGTSAGLAWPIAVSGALGYLYSGWHIGGLPSGTLGFWYLPAVAILSASTIIFAPIGVKAAHKLPPAKLKLAFAMLLLVIAFRMLFKIIYP
ncbi:sulfite exporter TauE/SafE family protein [Neisseria montereyensis]|uniref:Probable membrane transporter protein n=1 Tax=Neisseria montereyensis TaxID=2973938 RepID=A0ABT2FA88_9NEIS|nr:sulfite exporter TauE/SafE family protein [Neisseria montereyensis]MCS4533113.1 sulfite exporter TauE/SafE family protein [Neisseria montereyensis]